MSALHTKLSRQVARGREDFVRLLRELVQCAEAGEEKVQSYVSKRLKEMGCKTDELRYQPRLLETHFELKNIATIDAREHVAVVGTFSGTDKGRSLLLFAHPDGEPVTNTESWQHQPFAGEVTNGKLYGWSVTDDLVGVAIMLAALETLQSAGLKPAGDIILASTPSKGRAQGIIAVLDHGYSADAALYLHPAESGAGLEEIKGITSGLLKFSITVTGQAPATTEPTHTPFYHQAVDPLEKAYEIYQGLMRLADKRAKEVHYAPLEEKVGRSTNLFIAHMQCGERDTLTRVSTTCTLAGSITFPPNEKMRGVQAQVEETLREISLSDEWLQQHPPRLEWLVGISGSEIALDHPLYQTISQAVHSVTGIT